MSGNYVINIGRQLGSGGKEIGEKLAARLGIDFYDKELINLASEESGLCKEFFEKADEKASQGIIGGLFGMRFPFISEGGDALYQLSEQRCLIQGTERCNPSSGSGEILCVCRTMCRLYFAGASPLCKCLYFSFER